MKTTGTFLGHLAVATDGTPDGAAAVQWLASVASAAHAERVDVLHVWALDQVEVSPEEADDEAAAEHERLAALAGPLADTGVPFDVRSLEGGRKAVLVEEVERLSPDLVAIGQGHHRFGSGVVRHLAHELTVPLAVVPAGAATVASGDVVVGVDGSEANVPALRWAATLAQRLGRGLQCVYAPGALAFNITHTAANFEFPHTQHCRREIEDVAAGAVPVTYRVVPDDPVRALADVADEVDAPVIVVGTRGRGGFGGLVVGTVPMHLVQHGTRVTVLVPHAAT